MNYSFKSELNEIENISLYQVEDNENNNYIAENLFGDRSPGGGLAARDTISELEKVIKERQTIDTSHCLFYQEIIIEQGEYYLVRADRTLTPLLNYTANNEVQLETIIGWMKTLANVYKQAVEADLDWPGIVLKSLWVDQAGQLVVVDPIITKKIVQYRPEVQWEIEEMVLKPLEVLKKEEWTAKGYIYSLGIIFYYLLTDQAPFKEESKEELFAAIKHISPLEPRLLNKQISLLLNDLILECIAKEPEERVSDLEILTQRLTELEEKQQLEATAEEKEELIAKESKLKKWFTIKHTGTLLTYKYWKQGVVGLIILAALGILFSIGGYEPQIQPDTEPRKVVDYFYQAINNKNTNLFEETIETDQVSHLKGMLIETRVMETGRNLFSGESDEKSFIYLIEDLDIEQLSKAPPKFKADYKFIFNDPKQGKITVDMEDVLQLKKIKKKWKINKIKGKITEPGFLPEN